MPKAEQNQRSAAKDAAGPVSASVDAITEADWNALLTQFADANFYQTWAYGAVAWGEKQLSHLVLKQGEEIVAAAQLRMVRIPVLGRGVAYLRWGPLWRKTGHPANPHWLRAMLAALRREYGEKRGLLVRILPPVFAGHGEADHWRAALHAEDYQPDPRVVPYRTIQVDLTAPPEIIRKRLDGKWRNQLNAAERNGLTVREGTDDELYARFLALYDEMMARKRFETTVDPRQFQRLQQRLPAPQKLRILISTREGVPQAGLVATAVGETGIYLLGATSNDGMKSKGAYLLQWQMMNRLRECGCQGYDLGGINPQTNPGVYHFKAGLGGEEVTALGRFEWRGNWMSRTAVHAGERLQSLAARMKKKSVRAEARRPWAGDSGYTVSTRRSGGPATCVPVRG